MSLSIAVPNEYGYVVLTSVVGGFVTSTILGGFVMKARAQYQVPYPNLYATPGFHKQADAFNRVQRGHQCFFETYSVFALMALIGGLKHPIISAGSAVLYHVGSFLFLKGYADTEIDVATARYKKGGSIKWVGFLAAMGCTVSLAGSISGWW
jgi:glutathione S-transferase